MFVKIKTLVLVLVLICGLGACLPGVYSSYDFTDETSTGDSNAPVPDPSPSTPEPQAGVAFVASGQTKTFRSTSFEMTVGVNGVFVPNFGSSALEDLTGLRPAWEIF